MSQIMLRTGRVLGDYMRPYFVAELNTSHFGDIDLAKEMIRKAAAVGCDCVKFQSWSPESLYSKDFQKENRVATRIIKKFALSGEDLKALSDFARGAGVDFSSTPYSFQEAQFLATECGAPFIKIASMELDNLPYLREVASLGVPLVLSTGMGTLEEIRIAVATLLESGAASVALLHCTSIYPAEPRDIRLNNILGLRTEFPEIPIGYSDHTVGPEVACASVALGACLVEKHFTLDSSKIGMDNQMATEPEEMGHLISSCNNVYQSLGGAGRILSTAEYEQRSKMRRSMVAAKDLNAGDALTADLVEFARPGDGISPASAPSFFGKRLRSNISTGSLITPEQIET